ncbi:LuxR family transcriptional regulator [Actinoplanes sp. NBRC 103695]|uniref:LuxR family transcriptional regulator n=1 Tax=Actinoplanes sp. NBRC 103695 TaxID=3032202 RepID=UPI002553109A|nr:LuxR family transcriptional regulator [Actinoplanes sp. NBRC 103695]
MVRAPMVRAPRFTGRDREVLAITQALAEAPAAVLVEGEAGMGKSRLVRELLAATSPPESDRILVGTCPPFRQPFTLGPVVEALTSTVDRVDELGLSPLGGALRPLFPEWTAGLPPALEPLTEPAAARHRLFRAVAEVLERLDLQVLVLEDVHWADEATLEFLLFLTARRAPKPSLVLTYRPEDAPADSSLRWLASRLPEGMARLRVQLAPLDVLETGRLASSMLYDEPVSPAFAAFLRKHTDGLPLAIEESVRLLCDQADLVTQDGEWLRRAPEDIAVPPSVRDAVLERVDRLSAPAQEVLRAAAVLGDPVEEAVVLTVCDLPESQYPQAVVEALGSRLLQEDALGRLSFRHSLACRAVYESIPISQRRGQHLRAGRALEGLLRPPFVQLQRHFREAGAVGEWSRYAEQAADLAMSSGDLRTVAGLLHEVITCVDLPGAAVVRLMGKMPLLMVWVDQGLLHDLVEVLRRVRDDPTLAPTERGLAGWQLGRMLLHTGEFAAACLALERAIPDLAERPLDDLHATITLSWLSTTHGSAGDYRRWLDRAATIAADPSTPTPNRLAVHADRATILLVLGDDAGWASAAAFPTAGGTPDEVSQIVRGNANLGEAAMQWGRYDEARHRVTLAARLARTHGYQRLQDQCRSINLRLDWFTGAWDGLADRATALAGLDDEPTVQVNALLITSLLQTAAGDWTDAERTFRSAIELGRGGGVLIDPSLTPAAGLARLHLLAGRIEDALAWTEQPLRLVTEKNIWLYATDLAPVRVQALLSAGRMNEANALVTAYAQNLGDRQAPAGQAALLLCRAILAEGRGDTTRAAELYGQAADTWQTLPRPYDALLARNRQAACLLVTADPDGGAHLMAQVRQELAALGAHGDAERIQHVLSEHGRQRRRPRRGPQGYGDDLSPRELEVVRLLATGRTNREIANALGLSIRTVDAHVNSAMRKRKVKSRTALAVAFTQVRSHLSFGVFDARSGPL